MKHALRFVVLSLFASTAQAQVTQPLYADGKIPNSKSSPDVKERSEKRSDGLIIVRKVVEPRLLIFPAASEKANGAGVIIFPGGGYGVLASGHEGTDVATVLNEMGITAFVVLYRLPDERIMVKPELGPLQDAQRAIQIVRTRAKEWSVDPEKIGIIGFSAGGHLASTLGTKFSPAVIDNPGGTNLRPDFMILLYPVISADTTFWHRGSFVNLLGKNASWSKRQEYSSELNVTTDTPPTFLVHASDDQLVPPQNSIVFYQELLKHHVRAELHLYQAGGHGFGMKNKTTTDQWTERLRNWLLANNFIK